MPSPSVFVFDGLGAYPAFHAWAKTTDGGRINSRTACGKTVHMGVAVLSRANAEKFGHPCDVCYRWDFPLGYVER